MPQPAPAKAGAAEALAHALRLIAELAPTLRERNLRVLIALTHHFGHTPDLKGQASSRQLAVIAGLSRSNVQTAIDELADQRLITATAGTATAAATYTLEFMRTAVMSGTIPGPPPGLFQGQGGLMPGPQADLFQGQGGLTPGPPSIEERASGRASIDPISSTTDPIDRMLHAKPKHFDPAELATARRLLHGYQLKFGKDPHAHAPDDEILAQFLAVAQWPELHRVIYNELMPDRETPGEKYSWYVTVALQKIYGIKPQLVKARRAQLRLVKDLQDLNPPRAIAGEQQPLIEHAAAAPEADPQFARDLIADVQRKRRGASR
jgi:hypothetical protein